MERASSRAIIARVSTEEELRALGRELIERSERNEQTIAELGAVIDTLCTILVKKGDLNEGHVRVVQKAKKHAKVAVTPQIELDSTTDKYEVVNSEVDCGARMHLCHGRCCSFTIRLSEQDVREGELEWQIDKPYLLSKDRLGYCVYQQKDTGFCGTYQNRPALCRRYDCKEDRRIWLDYEKMIPAPMPNELVTIKRSKPA